MSKERALNEAIRQTDLAVRLRLSARASTPRITPIGQRINAMIDALIADLIELKCELREHGRGASDDT